MSVGALMGGIAIMLIRNNKQFLIGGFGYGQLVPLIPRMICFLNFHGAGQAGCERGQVAGWAVGG